MQPRSSCAALVPHMDLFVGKGPKRKHTSGGSLLTHKTSQWNIFSCGRLCWMWDGSVAVSEPVFVPVWWGGTFPL